MDLKDSNGKVIATISAVDVNQGYCDEGIWLEIQADDGTKPQLCFVKQKTGEWYIGAYRDANKPAIGCDFGICFSKGGVQIQAIKDGKVKTVDLFDALAKLEACPCPDSTCCK